MAKYRIEWIDRDTQRIAEVFVGTAEEVAEVLTKTTKWNTIYQVIVKNV